MEPAKLQSSYSENMLSVDFISHFLKLFKTYQKMGKELKDSTLEELLSDDNVKSDKIEIITFENIGFEKIKDINFITKLFPLFPNLKQINFAGLLLVLDETLTKFNETVIKVLNKLENLKILECGNLNIKKESIKNYDFFKKLYLFDSKSEKEDLKENSAEILKDLTYKNKLYETQIKELYMKIDELKLLINLSTPVGSILSYAGNETPKGFLYCDGKQISRNVYKELFTVIGTNFGNGDNNETFNLPDLRGVFLRGTDSGRGIDMNRKLGSFQSHQFGSHNHSISNNQIKCDARIYTNQGSGECSRSGTQDSLREISTLVELAKVTDPNGGNETRPCNVAVNYYIKY